MDQEALNARCRELMQHPDVKRRMWHPPMFWDAGTEDNPNREDLSTPRVDLCELEVVLATAALQPSQCAEALEQRAPGRAEFIRRSVLRGELPLLSRP